MRCALAVIVGTGLSATVAHGQSCDLTETAKLVSPQGAAGDLFGFAVAISRSTAVVGSWFDDDNGELSGSANVFRFDGSQWVPEAKLLPMDGATWDWFGRCVGVWGDTAIFGAYQDDDNGLNSGSAYVFRFDGVQWDQEAKLLAPDGAANDSFGFSVAVSGDVAVVGAAFDDDNGSNSGSAHVYRFDGSQWVHEAKLVATDGEPNDGFGWCVSVDSGVIIVGARFDDDNGTDAGSAYVYRFDGVQWIQEAKLLAVGGGSTSDEFGISVAIQGDNAVVGAWHATNANAFHSGAAYVFHYDGTQWTQQAELLAMDLSSGDQLGRSVSISQDTVVAGAHTNADSGLASGSAYVFRFDGVQWAQEAKLLPTDGAENDLFGWSVAVSDGKALVGAYWDDDMGTNSGSAYLFDAQCPPCLGDLTGSIDPNDASFGVPNRIVDGADFFFYLLIFEANDLAADLTGSADPNDPGFGIPDGLLDANDFFFYLTLFAAGC